MDVAVILRGHKTKYKNVKDRFTPVREGRTAKLKIMEAKDEACLYSVLDTAYCILHTAYSSKH
jgi:hypothetical protein